MSLKDVKSKIRAVQKIRQVTKAMEAVSAVKMRRSQGAALSGRPYALHAMSILRRLAHSAEFSGHPLLEARAQAGGRVALLVITADRGLAGAFNANVLRRAHRLIEEHAWRKEDMNIIAVGKKGAAHFAARGFFVTDTFERWGEGVALGDPEALAKELAGRFVEGRYSALWITYTNFRSTFSQEPIARRLLPLSLDTFREVIESIVPETGKFSELREIGEVALPVSYTFEPSPKAVLDVLVPRLLAIELYHCVLESNASEHSSRMVAMKTASDRARDLTRDLTLAYNKERQSSITAEIGEITTGIEAMR